LSLQFAVNWFSKALMFIDRQFSQKIKTDRA